MVVIGNKINKKRPQLIAAYAKMTGQVPRMPVPQMPPDLEMQRAVNGHSAGGTTKLHLEISEQERCALKISLDSIDTMADLQEMVAEVCEEAGYKKLDDLIMTYKRDDGVFATVTRSVTIDMLKESPALKLAPAQESSKRSSKSKSEEGGEKKKKKKSKNLT